MHDEAPITSDADVALRWARTDDRAAVSEVCRRTGDAGQDAWWTPARWEEQLDLAPRTGLVELMCHPGYRPSHVASGYGAQREVELATFLSAGAREALRRRGLTLSSWASDAP